MGARGRGRGGGLPGDGQEGLSLLPLLLLLLSLLLMLLLLSLLLLLLLNYYYSVLLLLRRGDAQSSGPRGASAGVLGRPALC